MANAYHINSSHTIHINNYIMHINCRAITVLQNVQDRINCKKLKRPLDKISLTTQEKECNGVSKSKRKDEENFDTTTYENEIADMFPDFGECGDGFSRLSNSDPRSSGIIRGRADISNHCLVDPPILGDSAFVVPSQGDEEASSEGETNINTSEGTQAATDFFALIQFIRGAVLRSDQNEDDVTQSDEIKAFSMSTIAKEFGLTNDEKQMVAFEVICSTFVLQILNEAAATNAVTQAMTAALGREEFNTVEDTRLALIKLGAQTHLKMFLTGAGGCGKSHVIFAARKFCHRFSQQAGILFDGNTFLLTAYVGSAAAIWGGITTHSAAHLNKKRVTDDQLKEWENVKILIVDEVSYFSKTDLETLERKLRRLKRRGDIEYGGVHIVFAGDLRQLEPVCGKPFYFEWSKCWQGAINCAIMLENNHRFKNDPHFGKLLGRVRSNTHSMDDIEAINSRFVLQTSDLPEEGEEVCYACSTNKERNAVSEGMFQTCLQRNPPVDSDELPSDQVIVIEALLKNNNARTTRNFHDAVFEICGDAQVETSRKKRVDPALKWYPGIPLMITSNDDISRKVELMEHSAEA
jgi:hypothetical protein